MAETAKHVSGYEQPAGREQLGPASWYSVGFINGTREVYAVWAASQPEAIERAFEAIPHQPEEVAMIHAGIREQAAQIRLAERYAGHEVVRLIPDSLESWPDGAESMTPEQAAALAAFIERERELGITVEL